MKTEKEMREMLNIPAGADVTLIDLDAQQKPPETITGGWTDTQIKAKDESEFLSMISSAEKVRDVLRDSVAEQEGRVLDLQLVLQRKRQLET